jgi:hypothetical protein
MSTTTTKPKKTTRRAQPEPGLLPVQYDAFRNFLQLRAYPISAAAPPFYQKALRSQLGQAERVICETLEARPPRRLVLWGYKFSLNSAGRLLVREPQAGPAQLKGGLNH